jgi:hypothetical protein
LRDSMGWRLIDGDCEFSKLYWLSDGDTTWIGSRVSDGDTWAWTEAESYWWDSHNRRWDGDTELCDLNPTHYQELPMPPS